MLSRQAHELATLVIARHILVSQAVEASAKYEYLSVMHEAPFDRMRPTAEDDATIDRRFREVVAELQLFPALHADLDLRIRRAWDRLRRCGAD